MLAIMQCPYCHAETQVTNSRSHNKGHGVWRRRRCKNCLSDWTTTENYDVATTHRVLRARTDTYEPFNRDILFVSIRDSLQHRKSATNDASALTATIISKLLSLGKAQLTTEEIKSIAVATLASFDSTAAAVYSAKQMS